MAWELHLQHHALEGFGNTTPLPLSQEFEVPIPEVMPALEHAASLRKNEPIRLRVERDVPYGQVTRLMQAGIGARIARWEVMSFGLDGAMHSVVVKTPGALPAGTCWMRAWIGPDARVLVGGYAKTEGVADAGNDMIGTLVWADFDHVSWEKVATVVRRLDAACENGGIFRVYAQPSGTWAPAFDLLWGFSQTKPPPKVHELQLQVPSLGPLDSTADVIK